MGLHLGKQLISWQITFLGSVPGLIGSGTETKLTPKFIQLKCLDALFCTLCVTKCCLLYAACTSRQNTACAAC